MIVTRHNGEMKVLGRNEAMKLMLSEDRVDWALGARIARWAWLVLAMLAMAMCARAQTSTTYIYQGSAVPPACPAVNKLFVLSTGAGPVYFCPVAQGPWVSIATLAPAATPGGLDTQVQFNDGGAFGGISISSWDKITNLLRLGPSPGTLVNYAADTWVPTTLSLTQQDQGAQGKYPVAAQLYYELNDTTNYPLVDFPSASASSHVLDWTRPAVNGFMEGFGIQGQVHVRGAGSTATGGASGVAGELFVDAPINIGQGLRSFSIINSNMTKHYGVNLPESELFAGTVATHAGVHVDVLFNNGATLTNNYGVQIEKQAPHGVTNIALKIEDQGTAANDYAIHSSGGKIHLSLPAIDPAIAGSLWNDGGRVVLSGSTSGNVTLNATNDVIPRRASASSLVDSGLTDDGTTVTSSRNVGVAAGKTLGWSDVGFSRSAAEIVLCGNGTNGSVTCDFRPRLVRLQGAGAFVQWNGGSYIDEVGGTLLRVQAADFTINTAGRKLTAPLYNTTTNCSSTASPAVCAAAAAGSVIIAAAGTTVTVNTTAVTANSQILVMEDSSLGTKLSVTCNTTLARVYAVSARTAATSFTITASAAPVTDPACLSYMVIN